MEKFLAAESVYIATYWVVQDPINVMVAMLGLIEKMGWPVTNQGLAKVHIIKSVMYVANNYAD